MTEAVSWDRAEMLREVMEGLSREPKELFPKYFYDHRGSELFEEITRLPEYYPTRKEREILETSVPGWVAEHGPATLVELGAGSARKTRVLLDAMEARGTGRAFVPVDVSGSFVRETAEAVALEYPDLEVVPEVADISGPFELRSRRPKPVLYALLGGTIGNFAPPEDVALLGRVRELMEAGDTFLVGMDLRPGKGKDLATVEAAYNDARGVTAEFNLNVLRVLNRELEADFDLDGFQHRAFYDRDHGRVELGLVARWPQSVSIPGGGTVALREGEAIRTELSCKFTRELAEERFRESGLRLERWATDREGYFAMALGAREG